jgi:hypothetical protein
MIIADFTAVKGHVRRERNELTEGPAGTFTTPEAFQTDTLVVSLNGQVLGIDDDMGIEILNNTQFRIKKAIDRHAPAWTDTVIAIYSLV